MKNSIKLLAAFLVTLGIASCTYQKKEAATEPAKAPEAAVETEAQEAAEAPEVAEEAAPAEEVPMEEAAHAE